MSSGALPMAIEVRIPTILRNYTDGAKSVEGSGDTLADLIADLDSRHGGLQERLVDESGRPPVVQGYPNHQDGRFLWRVGAPGRDGGHGPLLTPAGRREAL